MRELTVKTIRSKTRWLYHPVTIFLSIQVLWILLMVVWIRWYVQKHEQIREMAERLRAQAEVVIYAADGAQERARVVLQRCLPVKLKVPALNAKDGQIAIEEMNIAYERLQVVPPAA